MLLQEDGFSWLLMLRQYTSTFIVVREVFANTVRRIQDEWCYENPVGESQLIAHVKQPCKQMRGTGATDTRCSLSGGGPCYHSIACTVFV